MSRLTVAYMPEVTADPSTARVWSATHVLGGSFRRPTSPVSRFATQRVHRAHRNAALVVEQRELFVVSHAVYNDQARPRAVATRIHPLAGRRSAQVDTRRLVRGELCPQECQEVLFAHIPPPPTATPWRPQKAHNEVTACSRLPMPCIGFKYNNRGQNDAALPSERTLCGSSRSECRACSS